MRRFLIVSIFVAGFLFLNASAEAVKLYYKDKATGKWGCLHVDFTKCVQTPNGLSCTTTVQKDNCCYSDINACPIVANPGGGRRFDPNAPADRRMPTPADTATVWRQAPGPQAAQGGAGIAFPTREELAKTASAVRKTLEDRQGRDLVQLDKIVQALEDTTQLMSQERGIDEADLARRLSAVERRLSTMPAPREATPQN